MHQHRKITSLVINKHLATTLVLYVIFFGSYVFFVCLFVFFISWKRWGEWWRERQLLSSSPTTSFIFPGENMAYRHVKRAEPPLREGFNLHVQVKLRKYGKVAQKWMFAKSSKTVQLLLFHRSLGFSSTEVVVIVFPIDSKYEFNIVDSPAW